MREKEKFLSEYGLTEQFALLEKTEPNLWNELEKIYSDHENNKYHLENVIKSFLEELSLSDPMHSVRSRVKSCDSLIVKIIEKKCHQHVQSKYEHINSSNYFKIVTDLIGIRILIRYRCQWEQIHQAIIDKAAFSPELFIRNWEEDYNPRPEHTFIAERPTLYYRKGESPESQFINIEKIFKLQVSDIGYSSMHYIINYHGVYLELQVRTIFDEAWSECDHDFVYKAPTGPKKRVLQKCSHILSNLTSVADELNTFIRDYSIGNPENVHILPEKLILSEDEPIHSINFQAYREDEVEMVQVSDLLEKL